MDVAGNDYHASDELELPEESRELLRQLLQGESVPAGTPGLADLIGLGVAVREDFSGLYVVSDVSHTRRRLHSTERAAIARHLLRMQQVEELFKTLETSSASDSSGVDYMESMERANAALTKALHSATSHIWTAQPLTRKEKYLTVTVERDIDILRRGIELRTIYQDSARGRRWEREYVKAVSEHGAIIRTLAGDFMRIILVDSREAMVADHREGPPNRYKAFHVTHPGMVAFIRSVYEQQWDRATPWAGSFGRADEATVTNARQRAILRKLEDGKTLQQIAPALGVSVTTVNGDIKELYRATDTTNHFGLGIWWASSPERKMV
ncbi:helix-turn-helix transcriptional regulator [Streptomyces sp. NRRL S-241]|uniref:helix-turn-helix transcriptional regulator n=1 Tax=Streptomyces sp. NRRL S-241 TaxID=1463896 RepID=UPI0004C1C5D1|nr:LuxR C-terminal-related transcriptional regulator [Streptomyces sp. NRRL S-241]